MSNFSWHLAQDSCLTARSCANCIERLAMPSSTRRVQLESSKSRSSLSYTIMHIFFACTKTELICWLIRRIEKTDLLMETLLYYRPPAFVERRMSRKSDKNASVVLLSYKLVLARSLQGWAHLHLSWRSPPQPSSRRRHRLSLRPRCSCLGEWTNTLCRPPSSSALVAYRLSSNRNLFECSFVLDLSALSKNLNPKP